MAFGPAAPSGANVVLAAHLDTVFPEADVETEGSITFVATVGEKGLGDLRGAKALFAETLKERVDRFRGHRRIWWFDYECRGRERPAVADSASGLVLA